MADVVGVVFPGGIKVYHFDPAGLELEQGQQVVVQTSSGPEIGRVVETPHEIDDSEVAAALKKVQRVASDKDLEAQAVTEGQRREAMATCRELIRSHGLDMKVVGAEMGFGGEKITFSFFSEERVDFRALVGDLSKALKLRVELRQVGAREEARMVGGLGPCGRPLCCTVFPGDDDPVSIRMAKEQNLPLNPTKISGLCGRLMCCLKYEQEQYVRFRKEGPPKGTCVCTPTGAGVVASYVMTKDSVGLRMEDGSHGEVRLCACEKQDDGSLLVRPEEIPPVPSMWMDGPIGLGRAEAPVDLEPPTAERGRTGAEQGRGRPAAGDDAERPSRSRRSRSRRRGRGGGGQGQGQQGGEGAAGAANGQPAGGAAGNRPAGQRSGGGRTGGQRGTGQRGAGQGGAGQGAPGQPAGDAGTANKPRRRRRPRRPGGADGASGGSGVGDSGSASGQNP